MGSNPIRSKLKKAVTQPYKIPGFLKRQVDQALNRVEGVRIVWAEPGRARLERFTTLRPGPDEVLVRVDASLVSTGTEGAMFARLPNTSVAYPFYPGYSGAGEIVLAGEAVAEFKVGDRVAGAFPHASVHLLRNDLVTLVPDGVSIGAASALQLGVIALQAVRKAKILPGERVAILGPGLLGQIALQLAVAAGAAPVTVAASSGRRLALARELGAHSTLDLSLDRAALPEISADVTVDATGNPGAIHDAIVCTRPGGRIVLLGSSRGATEGLDFDLLRERRLTLIGAHIMGLPQSDRSPGWWPARDEAGVFMRFLADGRLRVDRLLTDEINPSEAELFYRALAVGEAPELAAVLRWDRLPMDLRLSWPRRDALLRGRVGRAFGPERQSANGGAASISVEANGASREALADKVLQVGLIGCGEIGVENARAVAEAGSAALAMVMDVNAEAALDLAAKHGVPHTTSVEALLKRDDIGSVLISTPHHLHAPLAIEAARAGKHIMVEKPMATALADADAMLAAAAEAGVRLSVIYCQRYLPYVQMARSLIDRGALGNLLGVHLLHYLDKPLSYWTGGRTGRVATSWRSDPPRSGGGILVFNLVHYLDIIRFLTGLEATRAYADHGTFDSPVDTEDTISIAFRYDNGMMGTVAAASCVRGSDLSSQQLRIWGTEGQIIVGEPFRFYSLRQIDDYLPGEWHTISEWEWGVERRRYVQAFADAVLRGDEPEISARDGRAVQAMVDAVYRSGELGAAVEIAGD